MTISREKYTWNVFGFLSVLLVTTVSLAVENDTETNVGADNAPYQLEKLVISAAVRREMAIRTIRHGLNQPRSSHPQNAEKIVCEFRRKTGTHFWQLICGSNSAWLHWSEDNISRIANSMSGGSRMVFDTGGRGRSPYNVKPGKFLIYENVTRGKVMKWIREVSGDDTDEINASVLEKHLMARAIGFAKTKRGYEVDDIVRYAQALREMRATEAGFEAMVESRSPKQEMHLAEERARIRREIIQQHGLSIEKFDSIAAETRADSVMRSAVQRALQITI